MLNNKRGLVPDLKFILIIFFAFLILFIMAFVFWSNINNAFQSLPDNIAPSIVKTDIAKIGNVFLFLDKLVPFIFLILWILTIIASITVAPEHPLFFLLSLGSLFLITMLSFLLVDIGSMFIENVIISAVITPLKNVTFFVKNYHFISFFIMIISLGIFYVKKSVSVTRAVE